MDTKRWLTCWLAYRGFEQLSLEILVLFLREGSSRWSLAITLFWVVCMHVLWTCLYIYNTCLSLYICMYMHVCAYVPYVYAFVKICMYYMHVYAYVPYVYAFVQRCVTCVYACLCIYALKNWIDTKQHWWLHYHCSFFKNSVNITYKSNILHQCLCPWLYYHANLFGGFSPWT